MYNRLSLALAMLALVMPALGGSLMEMCRSASDNDDAINDLCAAQLAIESLQTHLQRLADKIAGSGDVQKRKNEFVRFGRSDGDESDVHETEKRKNEFVRFGKRKNEFVRFGKKSDATVVDQPQTAEKRKNEFVRFG